MPNWAGGGGQEEGHKTRTTRKTRRTVRRLWRVSVSQACGTLESGWDAIQKRMEVLESSRKAGYIGVGIMEGGPEAGQKGMGTLEGSPEASRSGMKALENTGQATSWTLETGTRQPTSCSPLGCRQETMNSGTSQLRVPGICVLASCILASCVLASYISSQAIWPPQLSWALKRPMPKQEWRQPGPPTMEQKWRSPGHQHWNRSGDQMWMQLGQRQYWRMWQSQGRDWRRLQFGWRMDWRRLQLTQGSDWRGAAQPEGDVEAATQLERFVAQLLREWHGSATQPKRLTEQSDHVKQWRYYYYSTLWSMGSKSSMQNGFFTLTKWHIYSKREGE